MDPNPKVVAPWGPVHLVLRPAKGTWFGWALTELWENRAVTGRMRGLHTLRYPGIVWPETYEHTPDYGSAKGKQRNPICYYVEHLRTRSFDRALGK